MDSPGCRLEGQQTGAQGGRRRLIRLLTAPVPHGQGLYDLTSRVAQVVAESEVVAGLCTVFVRHTSASLIIQENADPAVLQDLQAFLCRLVPENDPLYTHREEGPDDMPAHVKGALTAVSLGIPILEGRLALGTWQGIFLWEHRHARRSREVVVHVA